jgi:hypothetical protein
MYSRFLLVAFGLFVVLRAAAPLHAQSYERVVRDTVALPSGSVSVENEEGSITVSTWDRDAVAYEARIESGQDPEIVENTVIEVDTFNQRLSLVSNFNELEARWTFGPALIGYGVVHPEVHYTLSVPRTAELSVDDDESIVEVTGLAAPLQFKTDESEIRVRDQRGPVRIDAQESTISLTDVQGDLRVDAPEGDVLVEELRGRLLLDTHEGRAEISVDSLSTTTIDTHEGEVQLTVPSDAGFDLAAELGEDATLQSDFSIDALQDEEGHYQGAVQGGGPLLQVSSVEGKIRLRRR